MPALIIIGLIILVIYLIVKLIIWATPYIATGMVFVLAVGCALGLLVGIFYAVKNYMASILENIHSGALKVTMMIVTTLFIFVFLAAGVYSYSLIEENMVSSHKNSGIQCANQHEFEKAIKHFTKAINGIKASDGALVSYRKGLQAKWTGTEVVKKSEDSTLIEAAKMYELRGRAQVASLSGNVTLLDEEFGDMLVVMSKLTRTNISILDQAIDDFSVAINLNSKNAVTYRERCRAYDWKGFEDKAIEDCNNAIRVNPNYALAYNNLGQLYGKKENDEQAIKCYTNAIINMNPKFVSAYRNRGELYVKRKQYDNAIADFEEALRIEPNNTGAKESLEQAREAKQKQQQNSRTKRR